MIVKYRPQFSLKPFLSRVFVLYVAYWHSALSYKGWWQNLKPDLVLLLLFYWSIKYFERGSFLVAWSMGLGLDLIHGSVWGMHSVGKLVVVGLLTAGMEYYHSINHLYQSLYFAVLFALDLVITMSIGHMLYDYPIRWGMLQSVLVMTALWVSYVFAFGYSNLSRY